VLGLKLEFIDGDPAAYAGLEGLRRDHSSAGGAPDQAACRRTCGVNVFGSDEDAPYEALKTRRGARVLKGARPRTAPMAGAKSAATTSTGGALAGARQVPSGIQPSSFFGHLPAGRRLNPDLSAHRQFLGALFELEGHGTQFLRQVGASGRRELSELPGLVS
jgi:hypothetical protein